MTTSFLPYEPPSIVQLLTLSSFLVILPSSQRVCQKTFSAGLLGPLVLGIVYGVPLGNIIPAEWQECFLALGYLGLVVLVFEGGLSTRLDLLWTNLPLSLAGALTGIGCPIALSFALLSGGYGYSKAESFILGAALSATSLGTTFAILGELGQTRVGTVIMSAAMIDDVIGLIMASVVTSLNPSSPNSSLGWSIGRPILAAALMTILVPVATHYVLEPFVRLVLRARIQRWAPYGEACILVLFLAGLCTIASYAGTSVLYGAYLSGTVLAYMDGKQSGASSHALSNAEPHSSFTAVYDRFLQPVQHALLEPLFFASIGFAIPFKLAWRPPLLWRGIVYALLMAVGKLAVGIWIPLVTHLPHVARAIRVRLGVGAPVKPADTATRASVLVPSALLGLAMVARGEIGLLILQLGYTRSGRLREDSFVVGTWAVVLNTLVGPLAVGVLVRRAGERVRNGPWGDSRVAKERADEVGPGQAA